MKKSVLCSLDDSKVRDGDILFSINSCKSMINVLLSNTSSCPKIETDSSVFRVIIPFSLLIQGNCLYLSVESGGYLTVVINNKLIDFLPFPYVDKYVFEPASNTYFRYLSVIDYIPEFEIRHKLMSEFVQDSAYPILQYKNMILTSEEYNFRDPSEIIAHNGKYFVYFTAVPHNQLDGFKGEIWCSSCSQLDDPSCQANWSQPKKVLGYGDPDVDHDGTGCFTPDCFYDGRNFFIFYTGLTSAHSKGLPLWNGVKEPEHIMVAKSDRPDGGFVKTKKGTDVKVSRALAYSETAVPGGHTSFRGKEIVDNSLIDHGQCWVMDDGERRYYYKGGQAGVGGSVCLIRHLDENWLNGERFGEPIINEGTHMEGILICRVGDTLFMQLATIWQSPKWRTYVSRADDGINWKLIDEGYYPKPGENYPMSIGFNRTVCPQWAVGQFLFGDGKRIGIGFLNVV